MVDLMTIFAHGSATFDAGLAISVGHQNSAPEESDS